MFKLAGILELVAFAAAGLIATGWLALEIIGWLVAPLAFVGALAFASLGWIEVAVERSSRAGQRDRKAEKAAAERAAARWRTAQRAR